MSHRRETLCEEESENEDKKSLPLQSKSDFRYSRVRREPCFSLSQHSMLLRHISFSNRRRETDILWRNDHPSSHSPLFALATLTNANVAFTCIQFSFSCPVHLSSRQEDAVCLLFDRHSASCSADSGGGGLGMRKCYSIRKTVRQRLSVSERQGVCMFKERERRYSCPGEQQQSVEPVEYTDVQILRWIFS